MAAKATDDRTVTASEARRHWSELVNSVARSGERVVVEKSGVPVAALISFRDLEWLRHQELLWDQRTKWLEESQKLFADVPEEEFEAEVAKAVAQARAELRAEREQAAAQAALPV